MTNETSSVPALLRMVLEAAVVVLIIALVVAGNALVWTNVVGLALVLHLIILAVATYRGLAAGSVAAIAAAIGLALLLDPTGSLRISDPANWVALGSFLVSAAVASRLVTRARQEATAARTREEELARLYQLSIDLFGSTERQNLLERATRLAIETIDAERGCLIDLADTREPEVIGGKGTIDDAMLQFSSRAAKSQQTITTILEGQRAIFVPRSTRDGSRVLAAVGTRASRNAVESIAALVSLTAEQERFLESAAHLEALEESDRLKTGILRAVSHDLATPLATITLGVEALERELTEDSPNLSRVGSLRQDVGMLRRRIENLLAMARIESGTYRPHPEPLPPADLFRNVRHHLAIVAPGRPLDLRIGEDCPDIYIDPSLALEIVGNLVDNAHRASPEGVAIELTARFEEKTGMVEIEVLDRGHGLHGAGTMSEGDAAPAGLGLEIARSLAQASMATLQLGPREGGGTFARIHAPSVAEEHPE